MLCRVDGICVCMIYKGMKMQWYYRWKLKKIQKKISELKELSSHRLVEDYTANSQLRILTRLEAHIQSRVAMPSGLPPTTNELSQTATNN